MFCGALKLYIFRVFRVHVCSIVMLKGKANVGFLSQPPFLKIIIKNFFVYFRSTSKEFDSRKMYTPD